MKFKKYYNNTDKKKWHILEKCHLDIGWSPWCFHSSYSSAKERNEALEKLKQGSYYE